VASGLKERYDKAMKDELRKRFSYDNVMRIPKLEKIVVNIGMGESIGNNKAMDAAAADLAMITGQKPVVTKSKKAISNFRLRIGMPIGLKVTLRGERMWHFMEKLVNVVLPRIRDFQGVSDRGFDGRGNYTLGLKEQLVFPEVEYDKIDRLRGLEITIVTTAKTDEEGRALLEALGMPFRAPAGAGRAA
jgi:large subunit ribosomal protein L5